MGIKKLSKEQELQLVEEYKQGASVQSLMAKYNFASKKSITDKVKKYYPQEYKEIIEQAQQNRKSYNYSLEKISSNFDAYFIGLLLTDGYISRGTDVGIDLVDEDCIAFISKTLGKDYKKYAPVKSNELITAKQPRYRVIISDRALVQDLKRFGVVPNKTYTLSPPELLPEEEKFLPYIIRGIIDGDGCVFETSYGAPAFYILTKSIDFANWLVDIFTNKFFLQDIRLSETKDNLYRIETANSLNILKIIALVYNQPFGMSRKYLKIRKMFRDYNNDFLLGKEEDGIVQTTTEEKSGLGN